MDKGQSPHKRQNMYKSATPPWKETYRKRCKDRLRSSREKFLGRFRCLHTSGCSDGSDARESMVQDLMAEEWKILRSEQQGLPAIASQAGTSESVDDVLSIFEEIREELILEEQKILSEYEAGLEYDRSSLGAAVAGWQEQQVVCPLCERSPLMMSKAVIFCKCGVRVDTEQDCISLDFVRSNLEQAVHQHAASGCLDKPKFAVVNQVGVDNLLMTCDMCDFMFIIV